MRFDNSGYNARSPFAARAGPVRCKACVDHQPYLRQLVFRDQDMMTSKGDSERPESHAPLTHTWRRLADQLGPLIGDNGFCALFGRACRVVEPAHRWLVATPPCKSRDAQVDALDAMLAAAEPEQAKAAHAALLHTFNELLAALIGQALAARLLDAALLDGNEQKNAQEHK